MKKNLGLSDRIIRVILGAVLAILYFTETVTGTLGVVLLAVGIILALTSVVSFCPIYRVFGMSSCPVEKR